MHRCNDSKVGVKVLSYDLLEDEERAEVDAHLEQCKSCRDLSEQTFGDEGAFAELEYRAFKISQRQSVRSGEYFMKRLRDLWLPLIAVVLGLSAFGLYLINRNPEEVRIEIKYLATSREAILDSVAVVPFAKLSDAPTSFMVRTDGEAMVLLYEINDDHLRRLIPGDDRQPPSIVGGETHEIFVPELLSKEAHLLLILAPVGESTFPIAWDQAVLSRLGGGRDRIKSSNGWPNGVRATLRWLR